MKATGSRLTWALPAQSRPPPLVSQPSKAAAITSAENVRRRLSRSNSYRTLVVESSTDAHAVLEEFALTPKPEWSQWRAVAYGCTIDWLIVFQADRWLPEIMLDEFTRCVVACGGAEQMRFLLALAQFDRDGNGAIDDDEWAQYEKLADTLIADSSTLCGNLSLVSALVLGMTHLVTIGRPTPFSLSEATVQAFGGDGGEWLLFLAYAFTVLCECCAFFVLCCALVTRNCLTNILPTRELKIDMLRTTNALGMQAVVTVVMLWAFLLASLSSALVASPTHGWLGAAAFAGMVLAFVTLLAPIRFLSLVLLHEEARRSLAHRGGSFKAGGRAKPLSQMMATV